MTHLHAPVRPSGPGLVSRWAPVVVYMAAIFFVSDLSQAPLPTDVSDKTGHLAAYAGLAVLAVRAVSGGLPCRITATAAATAFGIAAGYGAFDEVHQMVVPGRSAELADWYADAAGAALGIALCWAWGMMAVRPDA